MKILISFLITLSIMYGGDATIEVIKKVDSLPTLAVEDASLNNDETFQNRFFKSLLADLNVLSIFNVDRHHRKVDYNSNSVLVENRDMNYVLRYKLSKGDDKTLSVELKIINEGKTLFNKNYKINNANIYMFVSHAIAYDINEFMGEAPVEWMKRKVIFSRIVAPQKSELVIADYTLTYQHVVVKGGFNIFPKWANKEQSAFYYSSLDEKKPTLKYVDVRTAKSKVIKASDGMMVCSDVSSDGTKLLLTMAPSGQPDIYLYNVKTTKLDRLTTYGGIDVSGQFMGKESIVFISDRLGHPNVFSKNINSSSVEQMVYYGKSNAACSVYGQYIVYKSRESSESFADNTFNLHLISTETDFIRRLTAVGVNEFPRFSVDGDAIIFIKNYKSQSSIGIIRLNHNKNYLFPLKYGKVQSMDW